MGNMNYVSVVYFVVSLIVVAYWFGMGKKTYRHREERLTECSSLVDHVLK